MPLQFETLNHGLIAFGFFNIESDLLLLENNFIFADAFCDSIIALNENPFADAEWNVWQIRKRADMGDFMGAMHGFHHTGFFGKVYEKYPFPTRQADFKQKPEGWKTQNEIKPLIEHYGTETCLPVRVESGGERISLGDYNFARTVFCELIRYVWEGGFPKWKDGQRPRYVIEMIESIENKRSFLFQCLKFD